MKSKNLDHVYKLPEADFSGYKRVRLDPIEVEFDKNWKPNDSTRSPSQRLTNEDIEPLISMPDCIAAIESAFRDLGNEEAVDIPR